MLDKSILWIDKHLTCLATLHRFRASHRCSASSASVGQTAYRATDQLLLFTLFSLIVIAFANGSGPSE
jgi:hypothetical protein